MPDEMIRAVTHPQGDWYIVPIHYESEKGSRWFIDRVVLWALTSGDNVVDHVVALGGTGMPEPADRDGDHYFVLGTDSCPDGRAWNEVFRGARPTHVMVREITEQGREWESADRSQG